jgi:hypothetical protein
MVRISGAHGWTACISGLVMLFAAHGTAASRIPVAASLCEILEGSWQVHVHPANVVADLNVSSIRMEDDEHTSWTIATAPNSHFVLRAVIRSCQSDGDDGGKTVLRVKVGASFGPHESEDEIIELDKEAMQLSTSTSWKDSRVAIGTFRECSVLLTVLSQSVFQLVWMCPDQPIHSALGQRMSWPSSTDQNSIASGFSWNEFWTDKQAQFWLIAGAIGILQIFKWRRRMAAVDSQRSKRKGKSGSLGSSMKQRVLERAARRKAAGKGGGTASSSEKKDK